MGELTPPILKEIMDVYKKFVAKEAKESLASEDKERIHKGIKRDMHIKTKRVPKKAKAVRYKSVPKNKIEKTMHEWKEKTLHSGSKKGPIVKNKKQAIAISLNQARKAGANIPKKSK